MADLYRLMERPPLPQSIARSLAPLAGPSGPTLMPPPLP